jgi:transcriptional regulator with XRE-family HTH domain
MEKVVNKIKELRKLKGFSHENMAHMLNISQVAYSKIEKNETKLSLERLYRIGEILETSIGEILDIEVKNQLIQTNKDNSTGYLQQIENFHQENKNQMDKIIDLYEERLKDKNFIIEQLQNKIE